MSLKHRALPEQRRGKLKTLLSQNRGLRFIEAHNGLSAIVASTTSFTTANGTKLEFDGLWESSLTDSASKGHPDTEVIGVDSRLETIQQILTVTDKPMIVDGDTGGDALNFEYMCSKFEAMGVSAVIIEDKQYPKRNSLEPGTTQVLENADVFSEKIKRGHEVLLSKDFMIIARLESLIANQGMEDAVTRAKSYLLAGAEGIMIHSKSKRADEVYEFLKRYDELCQELGFRKPVVCVPTTYNGLTDETLFERGADILIYANHLLRAAHQAMQRVCRSILVNRRSFEADSLCSPVREIFETVGFLDAKSKDRKHDRSAINVIIPAAGTPGQIFQNYFGEIPVSALEMAGKSMLQRQIETLNNAGLMNAIVISGYNADRIAYRDTTFIHNPNFTSTKSMNSLFLAECYMENGFLCVNSDILFSQKLIKDILEVKKDIVLVVDNSITYHTKKFTKPAIDLVVTKSNRYNQLRRLSLPTSKVKTIGNKIDPNVATHEFIGIAFFSARGAEILRGVYQDAKRRYKQHRFQEADSFETADMNDLIQEVIDRGYEVSAYEVNTGWIEIENREDYNHALEMLSEI